MQTMVVRYKIYIEGSAWSVSEKYILACDSLALLVTPKYYDFFTRGLMPLQHYWPIRDDDKCRSIKFAVDWGNSHKQKVCMQLKFFPFRRGRRVLILGALNRHKPSERKPATSSSRR